MPENPAASIRFPTSIVFNLFVGEAVSEIPGMLLVIPGTYRESAKNSNSKPGDIRWQIAARRFSKG
jgi:hypothetical protein